MTELKRLCGYGTKSSKKIVKQKRVSNLFNWWIRLCIEAFILFNISNSPGSEKFPIPTKMLQPMEVLAYQGGWKAFTQSRDFPLKRFESSLRVYTFNFRRPQLKTNFFELFALWPNYLLISAPTYSFGLVPKLGYLTDTYSFYWTKNCFKKGSRLCGITSRHIFTVEIKLILQCTYTTTYFSFRFF